MQLRHKRAFSLIELLVVMAIMATIMAVGLPNYLNARQRARDAKMKEEMQQMKTALRLYYDDFQRYPVGSGIRVGASLPGSAGVGCGAGSDAVCGTLSGCHLSAKADNCAGATVYMKRFPDWNTASNQFYNLKYYATAASGQQFLLKYSMENAGDADIATTQNRCAASAAAVGATCNGTEYCVCED
jgi:prepilin-type N-terminal cleavage/methylation domain-containing protein